METYIHLKKLNIIGIIVLTKPDYTHTPIISTRQWIDRYVFRNFDRKVTLLCSLFHVLLKIFYINYKNTIPNKLRNNNRIIVYAWKGKIQRILDLNFYIDSLQKFIHL